ncbi:MAG: hypothetical protein L3J44_00320 [Campylobacteraceae bacterium]|nr:hypothetical protein [Campylobacteraceae bacterium]
MVLYDKKSNFLGIGQSELSMLGYEDIEEFKSFHDDFADLFVNHPGYISKFKNFSWIDYSLHSGVPNKNVILKHKNGTDIEAKLNIFEIFLIDEINEEKTIYNIEINTTSTKDNFTTTTDPYLNQKNIKLEPVEKETEKTDSISRPEELIEEPANKIVFEDFSIEDFEESKIQNEKETLDIDDLEKNTAEVQEKKLLIDEPVEDLNIDYEPTVKLKVDLLENTSPEITSLEEFPQPEVLPEIQTSDIVETISDEEIKVIPKIEVAEEDIDFAQIAEDTGMDIKDLAMFIGEFVKNSKEISKNLHGNNNITQIKQEIIELKGIASNLKMRSFVNILDLMLENCDNLEFENYLDKFDIKIKNLEN